MCLVGLHTGTMDKKDAKEMLNTGPGTEQVLNTGCESGLEDHFLASTPISFLMDLASPIQCCHVALAIPELTSETA